MRKAIWKEAVIAEAPADATEPVEGNAYSAAAAGRNIAGRIAFWKGVQLQ